MKTWGEIVRRYANSERGQAIRRIAIKRQIRRAGFTVPDQISYDIGALRRLRNRSLPVS